MTDQRLHVTFLWHQEVPDGASKHFTGRHYRNGSQHLKLCIQDVHTLGLTLTLQCLGA